MNKKYSILLALVLVASMLLAGCGSKDDAAKQDSKGDAAQTTEDTDKTGDKGEAEGEIEETTLGTVEGNVYTNAYAGFGCKLGENWVIQSAQDLQNMDEAIQDMLKDTAIGENMTQNQTITDMQAASPEDGTSVNVVYSPLGGSKLEVLAARMMSEEQIVDGLLAQKDILIQSYQSAGMDVKDITKATMNFLGEEHPVCKTHATINGADYYLIQLFNYDIDGAFGITTTFGGTSEESIQALMDCFYVVE